jgi:hypothetical protein
MINNRTIMVKVNRFGDPQPSCITTIIFIYRVVTLINIPLLTSMVFLFSLNILAFLITMMASWPFTMPHPSLICTIVDISFILDIIATAGSCVTSKVLHYVCSSL